MRRKQLSKQLKDRLRRVEEKASSKLLQKLLDASTHIDGLSDFDSAKEKLRKLRPALEDLADTHRDVKFKAPESESDGETWMTAGAIAIIDDMIRSGDIIIEEEQKKRRETDERLRLEANTSSKLLKKMLDATSDIDGVPDLEAAKRLLYAMRQDLEKLATIHRGVAFKPAPTDPTLSDVTMSEAGLAVFEHLYLTRDIVLGDEIPPVS